MLNERALYLINAEIDGELDQAEREELAKLLDASAEAREMKAELQRIGNLLDGQLQRQPPVGLRERILDQVSLPAEPAGRSWRQWVGSLSPASAGLAFATGLLATVAFYELTDQPGMVTDTSGMVGTMVAGQQGRQQHQLDRLSIQGTDLAGQVSLYQDNQVFILSIELDSREKVEVEISYAKAGLHFGGLAHTHSGDRSEDESYVISGGALRVENQGRQAFSVFLPMAADSDGTNRAIDIAIFSDGTQQFTGAIQG